MSKNVIDGVTGSVCPAEVGMNLGGKSLADIHLPPSLETSLVTPHEETVL